MATYLPEMSFILYPFRLQVRTMKELGSIRDIHAFTKASPTAAHVLRLRFLPIVSRVLKRTVPSDFRQLIWAILDARRQREDRVPRPSIDDFLTKLDNAEYPLWPDWAPQDRYTLAEIATLIDNAGFFTNLQKLCRETDWCWADQNTALDEVTCTPRAVHLPYYMFELYSALFHIEDGPDDNDANAAHIARLRANDHDTFVCFFAERAPQNKLHTGSTKATEHCFFYVLWVFGFLYTLINRWMGGSIHSVQGPVWSSATIAYQLSLGMPHLRKMLKLGVRAERVVHWKTDGGFLPGLVTQCVEMGFNLVLAPQGYVWGPNHDPRMTLRENQVAIMPEQLAGFRVWPAEVKS